MQRSRNQPLDHALAVVGDRWSLQLIDALLAGAARYSELAAALPGIAPNVLAARLRQLEAAGLVVGAPYSRRPVRLRYGLTARGRELAMVIVALDAWGADDLGVPPTRHHAACGTPLEVRAWCPTCERAPAEDEGTELIHL